MFKSDLMFQMMNELDGPNGVSTSILYWGAEQFFLDDSSYVVDGDGFINPCREPMVLAKISDANLYLMIPYTRLRGDKPVLRDGAPNWNAIHPDDRFPGFRRWLEVWYASKLSDLRAL